MLAVRVLGARAVQDVWMSIDAETDEARLEETAVRFYDAKIDAWHSVWISPTQGVVKPFVAHKVGNEIVLDGKSDDGALVKWIFSNMTQTSFKWRAEESHDNGQIWTPTEEMKVHRQHQNM